MNYLVIDSPDGKKLPGIPQSQYKYLLAIAELEQSGHKPHIMDVAMRLGYSTSSVSYILQNLRTVGLVKTDDSYAYQLTEAGQRLVQKYSPEFGSSADNTPPAVGGSSAYLRLLKAIQEIEQSGYNPRPKDISNEIGESKAYISSLTAELQKKGLVRVSQRGTIHLTEDGTALLNAPADSAAAGTLESSAPEEDISAKTAEGLTDEAGHEETAGSDPDTEVSTLSAHASENEMPHSETQTTETPAEPEHGTRYTLADLRYISGMMLPVSYIDTGDSIKQAVSSWEDLYASLCTHLYNNDPDGFGKLTNFLKNSVCPIHEYRDGHFRQPKRIVDRYMIETSGTPDKLLRKLRSMILLMNRDPGTIEIICSEEGSNTKPAETGTVRREEIPETQSVETESIRSEEIPEAQPAETESIHSEEIPEAPETSVAEDEVEMSPEDISDSREPHPPVPQEAVSEPVENERTRYLRAIARCMQEKGYAHAIDIMRAVGTQKPIAPELKALRADGLIEMLWSNGHISLTDAGKAVLENSPAFISETASDSTAAPAAYTSETPVEEVPELIAADQTEPAEDISWDAKDNSAVSDDSPAEETVSIEGAVMSKPAEASVTEPSKVPDAQPTANESPVVSASNMKYLRAISECLQEKKYVHAVDIDRKLLYPVPGASVALKYLQAAGLVRISDIGHTVTLTEAGRAAIDAAQKAASEPDTSPASLPEAPESKGSAIPASSVSQDIAPAGEISEGLDEDCPDEDAEQDALLSPESSGTDIRDSQDSSESIGHTEEPAEEAIFISSADDNTSPRIEGSALFSANITQPAPAAAPALGSTGHYPADMYTRISAYRGAGDYIFVSYSHKNQTQVEGLIADMQQHGYHVWFDEGIKPGTSWDDDIAEHIENCKCMIAMLSEEYMQSDNCLDELNFARSENKKLLLVYLSPVRLPGGMRMRLNRLQAIHRYKETKQSFIQKLFVDSGLAGFDTLKDAPKPSIPAVQSTVQLTNHTWIVSCNTKYYDVEGAFRDLPLVTWRQRFRAEVGDTVLIYVSAPVRAICYECSVEAADLKEIRLDDSAYYRRGDSGMNSSVDTWMELKLIRTFDPADTRAEILQRYGITGVIMGPRRATLALTEYLRTLP